MHIIPMMHHHRCNYAHMISLPSHKHHYWQPWIILSLRHDWLVSHTSSNTYRSIVHSTRMSYLRQRTSVWVCVRVKQSLTWWHHGTTMSKLSSSYWWKIYNHTKNKNNSCSNATKRHNFTIIKSCQVKFFYKINRNIICFIKCSKNFFILIKKI